MNDEYKGEKLPYGSAQLMDVNGYSNEENFFKPVSRFRRILPQVLACAAENLLLIEIALAMNFPTIVIPPLRGIRNRDADEVLTFTDLQASWFASIAFICQPLGSVLSGVIVYHVGLKKAMLLVNIPHIIAWTMLYFVKDLNTLFIANVLLGVGVGLMEAPVVTYVGEVAEPSVRGMLVSVAQFAYAIGCAFLYSVGAATSFRNTAICCCIIPIVTLICVSMIPETPIWLLAKNRDTQAMKALQWLRGWVPSANVQHEFYELKRYNETSNSCVPCSKVQKKCTHPSPTLLQKMRDLVRRKTLRPFMLIVSMFFFSVFTASAAMRPYYIQIFEKYNLIIEPNFMVILVGVISVIANIICMASIKLLGKRKTTIISLSGICISCFCWAAHTWNILPVGLTSFEKTDIPDGQEKTWLTILFFLI